MRFKLTLRPAYGSSCILPLNYQYELGAWIYRTLYEANPTFASWLHEKGYVERGKKFKLFSYSHFLFRDGDYKIFKAEQQIGVRGSFDLINSPAKTPDKVVAVNPNPVRNHVYCRPSSNFPKTK